MFREKTFPGGTFIPPKGDTSKTPYENTPKILKPLIEKKGGSSIPGGSHFCVLGTSPLMRDEKIDLKHRKNKRITVSV